MLVLIGESVVGVALLWYAYNCIKRQNSLTWRYTLLLAFAFFTFGASTAWTQGMTLFIVVVEFLGVSWIRAMWWLGQVYEPLPVILTVAITTIVWCGAVYVVLRVLIYLAGLRLRPPS